MGLAATKVFLIAGQSNTMSGVLDRIPDQLAPVPANVRYFQESCLAGGYSWLPQ